MSECICPHQDAREPAHMHDPDCPAPHLDPLLWGAYCRLVGRIEGMGLSVVYRSSSLQGSPAYTASIHWDLRYVALVRGSCEQWRDGLPSNPLRSDRNTLIHELCSLAHELAHLESRRDRPERWIRYFNALARWSGMRDLGHPLEPGWATEIYEEEERAERGGRRHIIALYSPALDDYDRRAAASLRNYRRELGIEEARNLRERETP